MVGVAAARLLGYAAYKTAAAWWPVGVVCRFGLFESMPSNRRVHDTTALEADVTEQGRTDERIGAPSLKRRRGPAEGVECLLHECAGLDCVAW